MIINTMYGIAIALSFGIIFNIKGKKLIFTSLGGGISWLIYIICTKYQISIIISLFIASIATGVYAEILARIIKVPVTIFIVCAIIPLVPGGGMYYTMYETIIGNINKSLELGLQTLYSAGAIAIGLLLVSSFTKVIKKLR